MNIINYGYIYNNIFNTIDDGILLQFSSSSCIVYWLSATIDDDAGTQCGRSLHHRVRHRR